MTKTELANGISLVEIPEAGLSVLCGCPENAVKFLIKRGKIREIEKDGQRFETGPNALLLSELPVQRGRFRNLGEFPVLQMLYRQGMIVPGHPNNTGLRPMLIGMRDQVEAQSRYIYSGNYGLSSVEELTGAGLSERRAIELIRMKLKFAFGSIKKTEELLDLRVFDGHAIELRGGAFVRRMGVNRYEFLHAGHSVEVDLDPGAPGSSGAELPYELPRKSFQRCYFSVIHLGEGDGWDTERPCMSSLIQFRGELYLVDSGPDIEASLDALGLGINDLRGIFHTHSHDDHFVGLTALLRAERRLGYFAAPWVRASVEAKLRALTGIGEREFRMYFEVRDLEEGRWNDVDGLEVFPAMSPHPVETTIFRFRARDGAGYRSYAHFADLSSFSVLDSMVVADPSQPGISAELAATTKAIYLERADVKKVDVGGGMIHGSASDFASDESGAILLSHNPDLGLLAPGELGGRTRIASFGDEDILIEGSASFRARRSVAEELAGRASPAPELAQTIAFLARVPPFSELAARRGSASISKTGEALAQIAASARPQKFEDGQALLGEAGLPLTVVTKGRAKILAGGRLVSYLGPGEVFGEEAILVEGCCLFEAQAEGPLEALGLPPGEVELRPIVLWGLREILEGRLVKVKAAFDFIWQPAFSVGEPELDEEHRRLFSLIGELDAGIKNPASCPDAAPLVAELAEFAALHFATEERLMRSGGYPELAAHAREHEALRRDLASYRDRFDCGDPGALVDLDGFLKDWALRHTLLIDRQYMAFLPSALASRGSPG